MLLKKIWVLVFSFMYLVSVDPMDRSKIYTKSPENFGIKVHCFHKLKIVQTIFTNYEWPFVIILFNIFHDLCLDQHIDHQILQILNILFVYFLSILFPGKSFKLI